MAPSTSFRVRAVNTRRLEGPDSETVSATPKATYRLNHAHWGIRRGGEGTSVTLSVGGGPFRGTQTYTLHWNGNPGEPGAAARGQPHHHGAPGGAHSGHGQAQGRGGRRRRGQGLQPRSPIPARCETGWHRNRENQEERALRRESLRVRQREGAGGESYGVARDGQRRRLHNAHGDAGAPHRPGRDHAAQGQQSEPPAGDGSREHHRAREPAVGLGDGRDHGHEGQGRRPQAHLSLSTGTGTTPSCSRRTTWR